MSWPFQTVKKKARAWSSAGIDNRTSERNWRPRPSFLRRSDLRGWSCKSTRVCCLLSLLPANQNRNCCYIYGINLIERSFAIIDSRTLDVFNTECSRKSIEICLFKFKTLLKFVYLNLKLPCYNLSI